MHILDIAQNSIAAKAKLINILVKEDLINDYLTIVIEDDGKGMLPEEVNKVIDPFYTSRTTRRVGLGIPLFRASALACNGSFEIKSTVGKGTIVKAVFQHSHIDRAPIGNMVDTIITLILSNINVDYIYTHMINEKEYILDTREIKKVLVDVPINHLDVINWIKINIQDGLEDIKPKDAYSIY